MSAPFSSNLHRGSIQHVNIAAPAAGANWTWTIDPSSQNEIIGLYFVLVTSAVVANRYVTVHFGDAGGNTCYRTHPPVAQTASLTRAYFGAQGAPIAAAPYPNSLQINLPINFIMGPLYVLSSIVDALDPADQFSDIWVTYLRGFHR